jgi:hypothetical protein
MTQFARPDADITTDWTTTPLWSKVDEASADDADFIQDSTSGHVAELNLSDVSDPVSASTHVVRWRRRSGTSPNVTIALYQGATLIASSTDTTTSGSFADASFTLSGAEADAITDYTDLRLRFTNNANVNYRVSQCWFECPDVPAGGHSRVKMMQY